MRLVVCDSCLEPRRGANHFQLSHSRRVGGERVTFHLGHIDLCQKCVQQFGTLQSDGLCYLCWHENKLIRAYAFLRGGKGEGKTTKVSFDICRGCFISLGGSHFPKGARLWSAT